MSSDMPTSLSRNRSQSGALKPRALKNLPIEVPPLRWIPIRPMSRANAHAYPNECEGEPDPRYWRRAPGYSGGEQSSTGSHQLSNSASNRTASLSQQKKKVTFKTGPDVEESGQGHIASRRHNTPAAPPGLVKTPRNPHNTMPWDGPLPQDSYVSFSSGDTQEMQAPREYNLSHPDAADLGFQTSVEAMNQSNQDACRQRKSQRVAEGDHAFSESQEGESLYGGSMAGGGSSNSG